MHWRIGAAVVLLAVALVVAGCGGTPPCVGDCIEPVASAAPPAPKPAVRLAPTLDGGAAWLNTDHALTLSELRGHVVVLDFWTYCCINCLHVLPELERLERQFADQPVQVIGVHSGKFDAEKDAARIRTAMQRHGVGHPVVVDSSFAIWKRFAVEAWPTVVIIGPEGDVVAHVAGEPKRGALGQTVQRLLDRGRAQGTLAARKLPIVAPAVPVTGPLAYPGKVAVAPHGDIAVADSSHHRIVLLSAAGEVKDVAGSGIAGSADGGFDAAAFRYPQGMVFDGDTLYVADTENHQIRALDLKRRQVRTIAGTGLRGNTRTGGSAREVALRSPWALALDGTTLYVAMAGSHQIWRQRLDGDRIEPFAGSGVENIDDGALVSATFSQPSGLALGGGVLYVADSEVSAIRAIDLSLKHVTTLVGTGLFDFGDQDGVGQGAKLQHALGITMRGDTLFVADTFNNKLKQLDPESREVKTVAGGAGELAEPGGLALLADGRILIADTNHHRLKTFDPVSGALEPFPIIGLAPPAATGLVLADNVSIGGDAPRLAVHASGALGTGSSTIVIEVRAPAGAKLTDGAPIVAEVDVAASTGLSFAEPRVRGRVSQGGGSLVLPVTLAPQPNKAVIEVSFFWCTTDAEQACYPAHAILEATFDVSSAPSGEAHIVFAASR